MSRWFIILAAGVALLATACASQPARPVAPDFDATAAVAAIRAAGTAGDAELVVRPLSDPHVEDLRSRAAALQARGEHGAVAGLLDEALVLRPRDPVLLQERAEAALLQGDLAGARQFARQAIAIGTEVGPLCRRHWETLAQVLAVEHPPVTDPATGTVAPDPAVARARQQRDACTVVAPPRY